MTAEQTLRQITDLLEAAKKQAVEKRRHFQSSRALAQEPGGYETYLVAAHQYAAAADRQADLEDQHEQAMIEAQAEQLRRERELQPQFDDETRQSVYPNLK